MMRCNGAEMHGGNLRRAAEQFGVPPECFLDFSANVNPRGLPAGALRRLQKDSANPALLMQYPDPDAHELRGLLSEREGVPREAITIGNGAAALIAASVFAFHPRACVMPVPAFSEYARACAAIGCQVHAFPLSPDEGFTMDTEALCRTLYETSCELLILNNPHNPSGSLLARDEVKAVLDAAVRRGVNVILDEAFIDYVPDASATTIAWKSPGVVAVRSLTKFYGCPALRIGYSVAEADTAMRIGAQCPAWPVTTLALNALAEAVRDEEYARDTLQQNEQESASLGKALAALGCRVFPGAANFLLIQLPESCCNSASLRNLLAAKHRILVRNCDSFCGLPAGRFIRVAVRNTADNMRLVAALSHILRGEQ